MPHDATLAHFVESDVDNSNSYKGEGRTRMKSGLLAIVVCMTLVMGVAPAMAADTGTMVEEAAATLEPNRYVWVDPGTADPVTVIVSIPQQRAFVYRGETLVAASSVSTGKDGNETPTGVYPILQKNEVHKSNLYNNAPMPFMQRLTWDGIALHAGRNPGFPDSHGCVRLPASFAKKLFAVTDLGSTVVVTDQYVQGKTLDPTLLFTDAMQANSDRLASVMGY